MKPIKLTWDMGCISFDRNSTSEVFIGNTVSIDRRIKFLKKLGTKYNVSYIVILGWSGREESVSSEYFQKLITGNVISVVGI